MIYGYTPFFIRFRQAGTSFIWFRNEQGRQANFFIMSKKFLYYCRISVKEGLDIETEKPHLERFIKKTTSRKYGLYSQLFIIAKNFKEDENSCNSCFKITSETGLVKCM